MTEQKQRILTGLRTTGKPHLGNYFGAIKPAVDLQSQHPDAFLFLADYHSLNEPYSADELKEMSFDMVATLVACGWDLDKGCFYSQSGVPEVHELTWILSCQTPYGLMLRAHSFKDAQAKGKEINMGVFSYPLLMAADILLYDANLVPVGKDQKQHLEMARDIAQRFNNRYGEVLVLPEPMISEEVGVVPGTDGEKMSKSKGNVIPIFASDKEWKKAVMSIETDSKGLEEPKDPETCNVFQLIKLVAPEKAQDIANKYRAGGYGYGHAKQDLLAAIQERFSPMRAQYLSLVGNHKKLVEILNEGSQKARKIAAAKILAVRSAIGVIS